MDFLQKLMNQPGVFDAVLIAVPGCGVGSGAGNSSMIHDGYDASKWCQGFLGNLGDTRLKTSKLCSVSSLDSWNLEFCGFLSAKPLRWRQPAEDPRKLGKYVNTGAEQEPLGDWGFKGPPPPVVSATFFCVANHLS